MNMNSRRNAAFLLVLVMIFLSLPFGGGDVYASVLPEENSIISSDSDEEVLKTEDEIISNPDEEVLNTENIIISDPKIELNPDTLDHIDDVQSTSDNTIDLYCDDENIFESADGNDDTLGAASTIEEGEYTEDKGISNDNMSDDPYEFLLHDPPVYMVVGQQIPINNFLMLPGSTMTKKEGMQNIEITKIPNTGLAYVKAKKVGRSRFTCEYSYGEGEEYCENSLTAEFIILDKNELHTQYGELEHAKTMLKFEDFLGFYFRGGYKHNYYKLMNDILGYYDMINLSPTLFKVKELSTNKEYYLGENYSDTSHILSEYLQPNVGKYEVTAIFPKVIYAPDLGENLYYEGPEASAMTLEITSVGGGEQQLVPVPVTSFTLTPKFIRLNPDYDSPDNMKKVMVEISPAESDVECVYWNIDSTDNAEVASDETNTFIENGKLYAYNWIYAFEEGNTKITVSTPDGKYHDEALVLVTSESNYTPVTALNLNKKNLTLVIGKNETEVLTPTIQPSNATDKNIEWSSDNPDVATVDSDGKVTAVSVGTATVTASAAQGTIKTSCEVTVKEVKQYSKNLKIVVGGKITEEQLAKTKDDGREYSITYSDKDIVLINDKGVINGKRVGHVTAKVSKVDSAHVIEIDVINPVFNANTYKKNSGDVFNTGFDAEELAVKYSSSNPLIAKIDAEGVITAISPGKTVITAEVQGKKYTANVSVYDPQISGGDIVYLDGKTIALNVIKGNGKTQWSSSDDTIATVDKNGKVKGISEGTVTITAVNNGKTLTKKMHVCRVPGFLEKSININTNDSKSELFDDAGIGNVEYTSSKSDIVSIDANGKLTGCKKGTAKITAKCGSKKYNLNVTVYDPKLSYKTDILLLNNKTISFTVKDGNRNTTWSSSDPSVVTVNKGTLKGLKKGTATITASNNGRILTKEVKVYNVPKFDNKTYITNVGEPITVALTKDSDMTGVEYSVNNKKIASIDADGIVKPITKGNVTVTAKIGGVTYRTNVKIFDPVINGKDTVKVGKTLSLSIKNGYGSTVWSSSDDSVATIDSKGKVKGISKGTVTITAVNNGRTMEKVITIE
ncbi:MAG: Ig-like domain-containing protein [Lachnospiraceae bacterium]|nr:Ig-like domain-containing protein [Lachnospiraceae bacterium]